MNLVPWGKVGKVIEAGYKAVKAVVSMGKVIEKAQGLLRRVEKVAARAQEIAVDAMRRLGGKSKSGGSCPLHSFVAGTLVLMADGSSRPIDQIQVGDKVKATDPTSGETSDREVVGTIVHTDEGDMTRLSVDGGSIDATSWHPVWVEERGDFVKIGTLVSGEHVHSVDGSHPVVREVRQYAQTQPVYDLTIAGVHTYYVVAGAAPILVHNCGDEADDLYRGVWPEHPQYADALNGDVIPTGWGKPGEKLTPEEHNGGMKGLSDYSSWTTSPELAARRAKGGVVLRVSRSDYPTVKSPDYFNEAEVLIHGPVRGAEIVK